MQSPPACLPARLLRRPPRRAPHHAPPSLSTPPSPRPFPTSLPSACPLPAPCLPPGCHLTCHQTPPCLPPACPPAGVVYPKEGATTKETGRRCERFGPLESFSLDFSDKKGVQVGDAAAVHAAVQHTCTTAISTPCCARGTLGADEPPAHSSHPLLPPTTPPPLPLLLLLRLPLLLPQVVACTKEGQYLLMRPAAAYKKVYTPLAEKAAICFEASMQAAWWRGCAALLCCRRRARALEHAASGILAVCVSAWGCRAEAGVPASPDCPACPACPAACLSPAGAPGAEPAAGRLRVCQPGGDCGPPGSRQGAPPPLSAAPHGTCWALRTAGWAS